jgi:CspA family cold shock protein
MRGTVKFWNLDKGWGFLQPNDNGPDCFVHITALQASNLQELTSGQEVSFDVVTNKRDGRPMAENIAVIRD